MRLLAQQAIHSRLQKVSPTFYSGSFFSTKKVMAKLSPNPENGSRIVIPISMGRYDASQKKRKEYDTVLKALFTHTATLLKLDIVERVDIISTAQLQELNWEKEKALEIEEHFFSTHKDLLSQQSNYYTWNEWIESNGKNTYESNYRLVEEKSAEGTDWYELMVKTHRNVKMSTDLEKSLLYQRKEYAAIMLMSEYDNIIYTGPISLAWSYMYHLFSEIKLPKFIRASFEDPNKASALVNSSDANHTIKLLISNIEQTLSSSTFPKEDKKKLIDAGLSLFYSYQDPSERQSIKKCNSNTVTGTFKSYLK